jgi:uncharacterized protein (AIM24 family)
MQKLEGDGLAFAHAGGTIVEKTLTVGETLRIDTGCLVAFTRDVEYSIEFVKKVKTALFGGEGLFYAKLRGPGKVWIQSLPFNKFADRVISASKHGNKDSGSILGGIADGVGGNL